MADLIVLGGCVAVKQVTRYADEAVAAPFRPGRTEASDEQTDIALFAALEPTADEFRSYLKARHNEQLATVT